MSKPWNDPDSDPIGDVRSEWQKRMGVGEKQPPPPQGETRSTVEATDTGATKETVVHADGRVDNFYTLPTVEVGSEQWPQE